MSNEIIPLAISAKDNRCWDTKTVLAWLQSNNPALLDSFPACIVIMLNQKENKYIIRTVQAQLKDSEVVALLEIVKQDFVNLISK